MPLPQRKSFMDEQPSRFSPTADFNKSMANGGEGAWSQYMAGGAGGQKFAGAASALKTATPTPKSSNQMVDSALSGKADALAQNTWNQGLGRNLSQQQQLMGIGFQGVSNVQQVRHAKEMADLQSAAASQQGTMGMIGGALDLFGQIGGALSSGGGSGLGSITSGGGNYWSGGQNFGGAFGVGGSQFNAFAGSNPTRFLGGAWG
jgi:hypothetical protein